MPAEDASVPIACAGGDEPEADNDDVDDNGNDDPGEVGEEINGSSIDVVTATAEVCRRSPSRPSRSM